MKPYVRLFETQSSSWHRRYLTPYGSVVIFVNPDKITVSGDGLDLESLQEILDNPNGLDGSELIDWEHNFFSEATGEDLAFAGDFGEEDKAKPEYVVLQDKESGITYAARKGFFKDLINTGETVLYKTELSKKQKVRDLKKSID